MRILKENVTLEEVLACYERENRQSESLKYGRDLVTRESEAMAHRWTLALLCKKEILSIRLPAHRHPAANSGVAISTSGMTVSTVSARIKEVTQERGPCWENILSHKEQGFSQAHVVLKYLNGAFENLDGLHRLVAWAVFEKCGQMPAYVLSLSQAADV